MSLIDNHPQYLWLFQLKLKAMHTCLEIMHQRSCFDIMRWITCKRWLGYIHFETFSCIFDIWDRRVIALSVALCRSVDLIGLLHHCTKVWLKVWLNQRNVFLRHAEITPESFLSKMWTPFTSNSLIGDSYRNTLAPKTISAGLHSKFLHSTV